MKKITKENLMVFDKRTDIDDIEKELIEAFDEIPFGNSNFQNKAFVLANSITPERAYRSLGLKLINRIKDLQSVRTSRQLLEIDVEENKFKISDPNTDPFERRRLEIKLKDMERDVTFNQKLLNDAIEECNFLYNEFKKFPKYTREEFERGEELHFIERGKRQIVGIEGGRETLLNATRDVQELEKTLPLLANAKPEDYQKIAFEMANKVFADGSLGNPEEMPEHLKLGNN